MMSGRSMLKRCVSVGVVAAMAVAVAACGGGGKGAATPSPAATTSASPVAKVSPAASAPAGGTASAGTSVVSGTPTAAGAAAQEAAQTIFHGVLEPQCQQATPDSSGTPCLKPLSLPDTTSAGISAWTVSDPLGHASYTGVLGLTADGEWKLWFSAQSTTAQLVLQGKVRVCADGQGLNLRKTAAATGDRIASIADNEVLVADKFVLTEPGTPTAAGAGWYHLTTVPDGWAYSKFLVDASQPGCASPASTPTG
jgi:hypothetical protein